MKILRSEYSFRGFLDTEKQCDLWFDAFLEAGIEYDDVRNAAMQYMKDPVSGNQQPHINSILNLARSFRDGRKRRDSDPTVSRPIGTKVIGGSVREVWSHSYKCNKCRDIGTLFSYRDNRGNEYTRSEYVRQRELGKSIYEYARPCSCKLGAGKWGEMYGQFYCHD